MMPLKSHYAIIFIGMHLFPTSNSMDRGAWRTRVHGFTKSWTWLSTHTYTQNQECTGEERVSPSWQKNSYDSKSTSKEYIYWDILIFVFFSLTPGPSELEAAMLLQEELELLQQKCLKEVDIYLLISQLVLEI